MATRSLFSRGILPTIYTSLNRGVSTIRYVMDSTTAVTFSGLTNTKTGTVCSTYRDINGKWQLAANNLVRIHRSEDLNQMVLRIEPTVASLNTNQRFNVTATTNLTKGGDALSVLSVVNDSTTAALIAASDLSALVTNGSLFCLDNTLGVTEAHVDFAGVVTTATNVTITGATRTNPVVITYSGADSLVNFAPVYITGVVGMTQLNGLTGIVRNINTTANTFELEGVNSTGFTAYVSGGNAAMLQRHSQSLFAAGAAGVNGRFGLRSASADNPTQTSLIGTNLVRYMQPSVYPETTADKMRLTAAAGKKIYFIGDQMERFAYCTTPMYSTTAATVTRNQDNCMAPYTGQSETGGFAVKVYMPLIGREHDGIFSVTDAAGGAVNSIGLRAINIRPMLEGQINVNSVDLSLNDVGGIVYTRPEWVGCMWTETEARTIGPNMRNNKVTRTAFTSPMAEMWFGKSREFGVHGCLEILEVEIIVKGTPTLNDMAKLMIPSNSIAIAAGGQSNNRVYPRDETIGSNKNEGEVALVAELQSLYPAYRPYLVDASVSGTNLDDDPSPITSWMKVNGGDFQDGELLTAALEQFTAFTTKGRVIAYDWNQGESDQGGFTVSQYSDRTNYVHTRFRTVQAAPVIIIPPSNRTTISTGYIAWREGIRVMDETYSYTHQAPETAWVNMDPVSNNLHISSAGTVTYAPYIARLAASLDGITVTGGTIGPVVSYIERISTDIYVAWDHDAGTDLTPSTAIQGMVFTNAGTPATISATVKENAFTTKVTLASLPTGAEELYYGYGTLSTITDFTKLIYDNAANILPARFFQEILPFDRYAPSTYSGLMIHYDSDISTTVSQRNDLSGNAHHALQATVGDRPTIVTNARWNKDAVQGNTGNTTVSHYDITTTAALQAITSTMTIEMLIKGTPTASFKTLLKTFNTGNGIQIQNDATGGSGSASSKLFLQVKNSAGTQSTSPGLRIDGAFDNRIHHIIIVVNNGVVTGFKDGVRQDMGTFDVGTGFGSTESWQIGGGNNLQDFMFNVYNTALSDEQCVQKYERAKARWQNSPTPFTFSVRQENNGDNISISDTITLAGFDGPLTATCTTGANIVRNGVVGGQTVTGFMAGDTLRLNHTQPVGCSDSWSVTVKIGLHTTTSSWQTGDC